MKNSAKNLNLPTYFAYNCMSNIIIFSFLSYISILLIPSFSSYY